MTFKQRISSFQNNIVNEFYIYYMLKFTLILDQQPHLRLWVKCISITLLHV